jgi:hypothetical protein
MGLTTPNEGSTMQHATPATSATRPAATHGHDLAAAALGTLATALAIYALGRAVDTFEQHLTLVLAAVGVMVAGIWFTPGERGRTRSFAIGGIVVTLAGAMALGGLLSQQTVVDEQVVTADVVASSPAATPDAANAQAAPARNVLLSRGQFEPLSYPGEGTASIIRTADGRTVLTLTDFGTGTGPDLDVRLVAGNPASDSDVTGAGSVRLGKLKGTSGNQQYVLPEGVDPAQFTHVYIWCRAFSVGFTRARLA